MSLKLHAGTALVALALPSTQAAAATPPPT